MNPVMKQLIRNKLAQLTPKELQTYAQIYGVELSGSQASQIVNLLKEQQFDPFIKEDLSRMFDKLEKITDRQTVNKAKTILNQLIQQYDVADWFK
ncbi:DUF2624 family protein [Amphibacillus cookii]|uniref:DUF2624 family protein n=1 Tax=Amphibacillus cookii TaxID=767787 RepID=UPI001959DD67|nr:DUF2624 family protein [Amphibacillus cookii]MBM7543218.1 uncharacterized protein YpuA (DUF1002 family) [Amphibacillus cookii]